MIKNSIKFECEAQPGDEVSFDLRPDGEVCITTEICGEEEQLVFLSEEDILTLLTWLI